jgi:hypothetical protein
LYSPEYWNDQVSTGTPITVTADSATTGIDGALSITSISGVVTDERDGTPLAGIEVRAIGDFAQGQAVTGADGSYTITGLSTNSYKVSFVHPTNFYTREFWNNAIGVSDAQPLPVTRGTATPNIDAALSFTELAGVVKNESGLTLANVVVTAFGEGGNAGGSAVSGPFGTFVINGLTTESYKLRFNRSGSPIEWWQDKPDRDSGDPIAMVRGTSMLGVEAFVGTGPATDTTPPAVLLNSPTADATYSLGQQAVASYNCSDDGGSGLGMCEGTVNAGDFVDTSTPGPHEFLVEAWDGAGYTRRARITYTVLAGDVTKPVSGGETVTTDPGNVGASPEVPVQTAIAVPTGITPGTITVTPGPVGSPPSGFEFFGTQLALTGPAAPSAAQPHVVTFTVDATALGGTAPEDVQVLRNGTVVADCVGPADAAPDPCVGDRGATPDGSGDAFVTVRTTAFSTWNLGRRVASTMSVDDVSPDAALRGVQNQAVDVTGTGFVSGAVLSFSGDGINVHTTTFLDVNHLLANVSIAAGASPGARDVTVTNPGPGAPSATCTQCFTVNAVPTITAVTPNSRPRGASNQTVTVSGSGFQSGAAVSVAGTGVSVGSVSGSGNTLTLLVSIDEVAPLGPRAVTVTNPGGGTVTKANAFTVTAGPRVTAVSPAAVGRGATVTLQLTGSGWPKDFTSGVVSLGPDISVTSATRKSATKLTVTAVVGAGAALGPRNISVTNPDGGVGTCAGCLVVNDAPAIGDVVPNSRPVGASHQTVAVSGSGFQTGVRAVISGGDVKVHGAVTNSETSVSLDVSVGKNAAPSARALTITNPDGGSATCAGCFTVNAKPTITSVLPSSGNRGASYDLDIAGAGFQPGVAVSFSGSGIQVNGVTGNATSLTVSVTVAPNASKGGRKVMVTNPDGGEAAEPSAFKVK